MEVHPATIAFDMSQTHFAADSWYIHAGCRTTQIRKRSEGKMGHINLQSAIWHGQRALKCPLSSAGWWVNEEHNMW
eukprot:CAMPEP_0183378848 /NCGR_PEP_ID=MMETSP0164_2-20130417/125126_1 /TAXON_ID=221442 /ORGANISM="Coccolithus pelagicus ssp braarudi, Strain PLY182g" /LENGTH=75 /DNA_ID=CAMNT_0025556421 /DNA_START=233 /DNA_END=457 /DNA_ORIENTATION=+